MHAKLYAKCVAVIVMQAIILAACTKQQTFKLKEIIGFYMPTRMEQLYGIWVNNDYEGAIAKDAKLVIHDTGYVESYNSATQAAANDTGVMTILKKWQNGDGSIWYIIFCRSRIHDDILSLYKISENNTVMEGFWVAANVSGNEETLAERNLSSSHPHYRIYHRQPSS